MPSPSKAATSRATADGGVNRDIPRRVTFRPPRTTIEGYDPDLPQIDLVGDEAQNDLAAPRAQLLKQMFPSIRGLKVLSTTAGGADAAVTKFHVKVAHGKGGEAHAVVTVASADVVAACSELLAKVRKAALNSPRIVPEMRQPVYEGGWGAMAQRALMCGTDLAPTFFDELKFSLAEKKTPGFSVVPLPRHIWQRGSALHELAVETARRDASFGFLGPSGWAKDILDQLLQRLASLLPAPLAAIGGAAKELFPASAAALASAATTAAAASEEKEPTDEVEPAVSGEETAEADEAAGEAAGQEAEVDGADVEEEVEFMDSGEAAAEEAAAADAAAAEEAREDFLARCSPSLLHFLKQQGATDWAASPEDFSRGLFARCGAELLTDDACKPLLECLKLLRDLTGKTPKEVASLLPLWVESWRPLRMQCHGDLRASNLLVDSDRKLHLIGFTFDQVQPIYFDVARLLSHSLVGCVRVDPTGDTTGAGGTASSASTSSSSTAASGPGTPSTSSSATTASPAARQSSDEARRGGGGALAAEARLEMLCRAIDVLLPEGGEACCHDSLLAIGALPIADLVPDNTPEDIKAAILIAQQMIESAGKTALAAAAHVGRVDGHDLHPICLLLPLVLHALTLCGDVEATVNQQRVAWHMARRAAALAAAFLGSGLGAGGKAPGGGDMARSLAAARREVEDVRKEADVAMQFQKALVERLTSELESLKSGSTGHAAHPTPTPSKKNSKASGGSGGGTNGGGAGSSASGAAAVPGGEKKAKGGAAVAAGSTPGKKPGGSTKKKAMTERKVDFATHSKSVA